MGQVERQPRAATEVRFDSAVWSAVERLNDHQQVALRLACVEKLKCAAIAQRIGVTTDEVVAIISEAMNVLRQAASLGRR